MLKPSPKVQYPSLTSIQTFMSIVLFNCEECENREKEVF